MKLAIQFDMYLHPTTIKIKFSVQSTNTNTVGI